MGEQTRWAVRQAAPAAGLLAVALLSGQSPEHDVPWWAATLAALVAVGLRNRWPVAMLVICTLSTAAHLFQGRPVGVVDGCLFIVLYAVGVHRSRTVSAAALAGLLLTLACWSGAYALRGRLVPGLPMLAFQVTHSAPGRVEFVAGDRPGGAARWSGPVVLGSLLVAGWAAGSGTRTRRAYLDQLAARARDLEREREQSGALAVAAERGRISRELHDVVAHGLSLIVIQAQGGAAALDAEPAETRAALAAIVHTGRESLADMRRVLGALGEVGDAWHPQPGLAHLPALVDQVRRTGTGVRLDIEGVAAALPAPLDLSAYRIVQEALTNVMKHAGPGASASVVLAYAASALDIRVADDGVAVPVRGSRPGNGIGGMRERVRLLGGHFRAGPLPGGGFEVRATLPIEASHA
ncbi:sensor histidine kinase [Streptosporangium sp. NPDC023963]|uniref:sensor histidine kinase n=1 Tax=Streptosporangium sp. NPDC023963 TaxID=3155608 RepID=UPI003441D3F9